VNCRHVINITVRALYNQFVKAKNEKYAFSKQGLKASFICVELIIVIMTILVINK